MAERLLQIVEVRCSSVTDVLALPVAERVDESNENISKTYWFIQRAQAYRISTPPVIKASAVPSAYLFQLSAVPTFTPGWSDLMSLMCDRSSGPVKFPRYRVSEPTVIAYTEFSFPAMAVFRASLSVLNESGVSGLAIEYQHDRNRIELSEPTSHECLRVPYQIPRMTWKPLLAAAGSIAEATWHGLSEMAPSTTE